MCPQKFVFKVKDDGRGDASSYDRGDRRKRRGDEDRHRDRRDRGDRDRGDSDRRRDRDRKRNDRSRDSRRSRSRERERRRSRDRGSGRRSRSFDRFKKRSPPRRKSRSRSRERGGGGRDRSSSTSPFKFTRLAGPDLTPEERDARTVFCMQLAARIRPRDLEEFFSSVGKVRDVRLIMDNKTRRSKGIAYVEFYDTESVPLAIGLTNQKLLGVPIIVQPSQAEKNRLANATNILTKGLKGPMRLYVGSLHFNITEEMLRGIFEPFGKIDDIKLIRDHETTRSQGYGFITFTDAEEAKKALEQLNGFELAGRPMKVGHVTERQVELQQNSMLDSDEMDRAGIDLGATGRLQLMAKLAEGTGFQIPEYAASALNMGPGPAPPNVSAIMGNNPQPQQQSAPPIATQCFMLSNMFDPTSTTTGYPPPCNTIAMLKETKPSWDQEIRDDVIDECNKHGGVLHLFVDKASPQGNVYVKCPTIAAAVASVNALHGRYFAGKMITAAYVPLPNYHSLFPDAVRANQLMLPSTQALQAGYSGIFNNMQQQPMGIR
ncbi:RNA-binding protein 39-like isoform X2 [Mytilus galloprovincialis]|uniref:RNA-binding protein 39-like isoform X2 n=1 Tax=Mytilus galloprovincialis TaxID=29158 RepID=UPI003F7CA46F